MRSITPPKTGSTRVVIHLTQLRRRTMVSAAGIAVALASTLCAGIAFAESPEPTPAVPNEVAIETMTSGAAALDTTALDKHLIALSEALSKDSQAQIETDLAAAINLQIPESLDRAIALAEHYRLRRSMSPSLASAPSTRLTATSVPAQP